MLTNRSAPPGPIVPRLIYRDVAKAIEWLQGAFGFTERLRTPPEPDGTIHHAQLAVGQGSIILTGQPDVSPPAPVGPGKFTNSLLVAVPDVDAHFHRAKEFGALILSEPRSHPFGERQYSAQDLGGYHWGFTQSIADAEPESWGAVVTRIDDRRAILARPRFCYIEIPAADVRQSALFYEKVFGWNIRKRESNRPSFDDATGDISGAWVTGRPASQTPGLLPYIWVDNIESSLDLAVSCGAEIVVAPQPDSPGGTSWFANFRDPAGNVIGLYQEEHP